MKAMAAVYFSYESAEPPAEDASKAEAEAGMARHMGHMGDDDDEVNLS